MYDDIYTLTYSEFQDISHERDFLNHIRRSLDVLRQSFEDDILRDQDPWREAEKSDRLLQLLPDKSRLPQAMVF
jgi:hypothetical protein